jgi:ATP:ADP antiporter, AAA family
MSSDIRAAQSVTSARCAQERQLLDRFLSLFTEVQHGEGIGALLLGANIFLLLGAYYILKTVREALILSEGGAEIKAYSAAAQPLYCY